MRRADEISREELVERVKVGMDKQDTRSDQRKDIGLFVLQIR